jgi:hypothetical protein
MMPCGVCAPGRVSHVYDERFRQEWVAEVEVAQRIFSSRHGWVRRIVRPNCLVATAQASFFLPDGTHDAVFEQLPCINKK